MSTVSVVVVTYNAAEWVPRCLAALREQQTEHEVELVVLDNASPDYGEDELRSWAGPEATVVALDDNVGFARGCNVAAQHATGDYILLLNPDALLEPGSIDALVAFHRDHPDAGIVGGRVTTPTGELDHGSCFGFQTTWSLFCFATGLSAVFPRSVLWNPEGLGAWERDSPRRVDIVTGCLLLVDRPLWDRLGGFDERFFMYGEDADLGARARAAGARSYVTPDASVVHALGASSHTTVRKQVLLFRGKVSLVLQHRSPRRRALGVRLLLAGVALRALGERITRTDRAGWRGLWGARHEWSGGW